MMRALAYGELQISMGTIGVLADQQFIRQIYFVKNKGELKELLRRDFSTQNSLRMNVLTAMALEQLNAYFSAERAWFDLPLAIESLSVFAQRVHHALSQVPYGQKTTYSQLAARAGSKSAARAVGTVMAKNPFPIVIPCHRVVRSDGTLGEYSGGNGIETKRRLLEFEANHKNLLLPSMNIPYIP